MERYVALSGKNLKRCYEWAEANDPQHPLAKAYMWACSAILLDVSEIVRALPGGKLPMNPDRRACNRWSRVWSKVDVAAGLGYQHRDALGRLILQQLAPRKKRTPRQRTVYFFTPPPFVPPEEDWSALDLPPDGTPPWEAADAYYRGDETLSWTLLMYWCAPTGAWW
jgi:hypothetical protein